MPSSSTPAPTPAPRPKKATSISAAIPALRPRKYAPPPALRSEESLSLNTSKDYKPNKIAGTFDMVSISNTKLKVMNKQTTSM